jgi:Mrp family chromosome partitioning ATPase
MPLLPSTLSHAGHDAYALLAATLAKDANKHAVLITGPTPGDGKTTTALNLATSIAASDRVVLVEGDSRRPKLAQSLRLAPNHGLADVLAGRAPLSDALLPGAPGAPGVQLLLQNPAGSRLPAFATNASADALIRDAELLADWLVIDAPPLTAVPDVLPFAQRVDDVIIVVQLGNTRLKQLAQLAELLVQQEIRPTGFLLIGGKNAAYYG